MNEELTEHFNNIYTNGGGFYGVIEEIEDKQNKEEEGG